MIRNEKLRAADLKWQDHGGWLYAFVVNDDVRYIGLASRVLRSRLDDYTHMKHEHSSRMRDAIFAEMTAGHSVKKWGLKEPDPTTLQSKELELRTKYSLPWNRI